MSEANASRLVPSRSVFGLLGDWLNCSLIDLSAAAASDDGTATVRRTPLLVCWRNISMLSRLPGSYLLNR